MDSLLLARLPHNLRIDVDFHFEKVEPEEPHRALEALDQV